jgi:hypothetical protein
MRFTAMIVALLLIVPTLAAEENNFTIEIRFDRSSCAISLHEDDRTITNDFRFSDVRIGHNEVTADGRTIVDATGFHFRDRIIPIDDIDVDRVTSVRDNYRIVLAQKVVPTSRRRARGGDIISAFRNVDIGDEEFIRGDILVIGADLHVEGEVNGDIVVLFGNVRLTGTSVCWRDVLAIDGTINRHREARVYGTYQATKDWRKWSRHERRHYTTEENEIGVSGSLSYDRVDGLGADVGISFNSEERFMPEFFAHYGYGFWSQQSKYRLGFEQKLFNYYRLSFGGQVYRLTKTEDEWRCPQSENNLYAVLAREDFRDYYEGEGGSFFVQQEIAYTHTFRVEYSTEDLRFMNANPDLWSLFGGDKKFRANFSSVDDQFLADHMPDYDKDESVLAASYEFNDTEDRYGELMRSGWYARVAVEHSSEGIGSDFDYDRYTVELRRYQPLTYRQNFNIRLLYGNATGTLPLHRYFYLGGIRTLRAYGIKEFYGSHMALANLEYVVDFPRSDIGVSLLFDTGKTGWDGDFLSEGDWIGDVGIGCRLADIRLELTRQINGYTNDLQFSILIGRSF